MITKVLHYDTKQKVKDIEIHKGASEYAESFRYYANKDKFYDVDLHYTYFDVFGNDELLYRYCLIENETLDDYAEL